MSSTETPIAETPAPVEAVTPLQAVLPQSVPATPAQVVAPAPQATLPAKKPRSEAQMRATESMKSRRVESIALKKSQKESMSDVDEPVLSRKERQQAKREIIEGVVREQLSDFHGKFMEDLTTPVKKYLEKYEKDSTTKLERLEEASASQQAPKKSRGDGGQKVEKTPGNRFRQFI